MTKKKINKTPFLSIVLISIGIAALATVITFKVVKKIEITWAESWPGKETKAGYLESL